MKRGKLIKAPNPLCECGKFLVVTINFLGEQIYTCLECGRNYEVEVDD